MFTSLFHPLMFRRFRQKDFLLELWKEVNVNLERFYVIDQRQFITMAFELSAWEDIKHFSGAGLPMGLYDYAAAIEDFNRAFVHMKEFENIYSSDVRHKTRENAEILHARKEALEEKIKALLPHILSAEKNLRLILDKK